MIPSAARYLPTVRRWINRGVKPAAPVPSAEQLRAAQYVFDTIRGCRVFAAAGANGQPTGAESSVVNYGKAAETALNAYLAGEQGATFDDAELVRGTFNHFRMWREAWVYSGSFHTTAVELEARIARARISLAIIEAQDAW